MSSKCFVLSCKNTVGVSFPKDVNLKETWLNSLKIKNVIPNPSSIVCLDHFDESDIYETVDEGGVVLKTVRANAVPKINFKECDNNGEYIENCSEDVGKEETCNSQIENGPTDVNCNEKVQSEQQINEDVCATNVGNYEVKEVEDVAKGNNEVQGKMLVKVEQDVPEIVMFNEIKSICRLCGNDHSNIKNIFQEKIENVLVSVAIMECIYPIEILENDQLSKEICLTCLDSLTSYFKFRSICLENDKKQRDLYHNDNQQTEPSTVIFPSTSKNFRQFQKRSFIGDHNAVTRKKQRIEDHMFIDSEDDYSDQDDLESLSDFIVKSESTGKKPTQIPTLTPLPLIALKKKENTIVIKQMLPEVDKKFEKVEQELRKVLEGQLTEEQAQAENIIIHVANDEEEQSPHKLAMVTKLKLPIVIKPVHTTNVKQEAPSTVNRRKIIEDDFKISSKEIINLNTVSLPKSINVSVNDSFRSDIGVFEGLSLTYLFNIEFCQVDGYLYEYRMCKGNTRFLRCVLPTCQALAVQNKVGMNLYSSQITIQKPHSHKRPDDVEKKKQMFYYVMKRKMQGDKTLNFKNVYEEACKSDPEIKNLIPLRNVINEICRHQLTYKIPKINSFEHFYDHIEDDAFQKLHFTHNGKQFYQEKFTADDNSRAIVFANMEIIEQVSFSNLMYVDASFKIDTNEEFKYQLVTVLVWFFESYYPILYALVNQKTQEIYKKIFEYLHDTLAPKLRPEEIVTDYEANLYYALGETYLNSSIGGSVFYYTQNLYKKICALNLSRDLETNSYFRNIYHMLLMLPLLPVNTILDGLKNMEVQARDLGLTDLTRAIFDHVRTDWIMKVTPDLFCVHRLENRINENVIAPFKKLRDFIMVSKGKLQKQNANIATVVEKLIELEHFLQITYSSPNKKSFARDLSSSQKKNVLKAWQYIESHPKININNFFSKVLGYIKCMENQLWIWGFYRYEGDIMDELINATNFSIFSNDPEIENLEVTEEVAEEVDTEFVDASDEIDGVESAEVESGQVVMEAVIDENGSFVLQNRGDNEHPTHFENAFLKYVYKE